MKLLTRLKLELNYLNEERFKDNFKNCISPICTCGLEVESAIQLFLHCHQHQNIRAKLLNSIELIDRNLLTFSEKNWPKFSLRFLSTWAKSKFFKFLNNLS